MTENFEYLLTNEHTRNLTVPGEYMQYEHAVVSYSVKADNPLDVKIMVMKYFRGIDFTAKELVDTVGLFYLMEAQNLFPDGTFVENSGGNNEEWCYWKSFIKDGEKHFSLCKGGESIHLTKDEAAHLIEWMRSEAQNFQKII